MRYGERDWFGHEFKLFMIKQPCIALRVSIASPVGALGAKGSR